MPQSLAERKAELDALTEGFLIPIFQREDPLTGRMLNGLSPADYRRVVAGYACPDCLCKFKTYLATCPVCGWQRNIADDVAAPPDYWVQHLEDRESGFAPTVKRTIDQVLKEIHEDPDVEQIPLRKLRNSRKRA